MRVSYRDEPHVSFKANVIRAWERGEIEAPVMSASSGPKDYVRNHVFAIFDRHRDAARVLMMRGEYTRSVPFLLIADADGHAFDMVGREVVIES